jgi:hypothetical protein
VLRFDVLLATTLAYCLLVRADLTDQRSNCVLIVFEARR